MKIAYVYLVMRRDDVRHKFVKNIISKNNKFEIFDAIDGHDIKAVDEVCRKFEHLNIPNVQKFLLKGDIRNRKLAVYGSYINLLEKYCDYDYVVVLQDDTFFEDNFYIEIEQLINSGYIDTIYSSRLGQFLSGAIFHKKFYRKFIESLQKHGLNRPLDHCLIGLSPHEQLMREYKKEIVFVKNYTSNIK